MSAWNLKVTRGRREPVTVQASPDLTVDALTERIQKLTHVHKYRQGLKFTNKDNKVIRLTGRQKTLQQYGMTKDTELELKDMGPQFSYRGVFVVEYLGPILIMLAYAARPDFLYGKGSSLTSAHWVAKYAIVAWVLHFLKRELETFFVHRFSRPTMPLMNLFKNSIYYWGFALAVGYPLCSPNYVPPTSSTKVFVGLAIMAISELLNFSVHVQLRNMRPKEGSDERRPPTGGLFNLASCPNYTFEVLGWVGFSIATNVAYAYVFTLIGFLQMTDWALKKHRAYIKLDSAIRKRAAIVPGVI